MTNLEKRVDQNKIEDRLNTQISHGNDNEEQEYFNRK
jgi:hypothetical protein